MKMLSGVVVSTLLLCSGSVHAITPAMPQSYTCPLTGQNFQGYAAGSYTVFGLTMDFEPMVMGGIHRSQAYVPQCPDSDLPLYRTFDSREIEALRGIVTSSDWQEHRRWNNPYYLIAYLQSKLNDGDAKVANSLLHAVWSSNDADRKFYLDKAIIWWGRLASDEHDHDREWIIGNWLLADLNRQAGHFDAALSALRAVRAKMPIGVEPVTVAMMDYEHRLIEARDIQSRPTPEASRR